MGPQHISVAAEAPNEIRLTPDTTEPPLITKPGQPSFQQSHSTCKLLHHQPQTQQGPSHPEAAGSCSTLGRLSIAAVRPCQSQIEHHSPEHLSSGESAERRMPQATTSVTLPIDERPRCYEHGCGGRAFSCMENYRRHVRERSGLSNAQCPYCNSSFSRKSNLNMHLSCGRCRVLNDWISETAVDWMDTVQPQ
ncbi:hypothetical protein K431DRAFT_344724 [Polychaeton citri CBS 116435]|uniref:C2H2-type domain-containing protein n=1 Tax=Polychaeton citri CBS 116435 TaxID=1314669 RepID=A0A9P4QF14_9PEZI|nr:hypothetical protein K431DRAFT_344724 [Polychaeton citri CBS 116435]